MPGRKRKGSAVAERDGTYKKNPQRRNTKEPKTKRGFPDKPVAVLECEIASDQWDWICGQLDQMGVLMVADLLIVEQLATTYSDWRLARERVRAEGMTVEGQRGPVRNPVMLDYHNYANRIAKLLAELGLTPSSRTRLVADTSGEDDPFREYLEKLKASKN